MKYRRLSTEELKELEKEFINFLVSNTITGDDWEKIKSESPEKADRLIVTFSDIVLQKALEKIKFIEYRSAKDWKIFQCLSDKMILRGFSTSPASSVDFNNHDIFEKLQQYPIQVYTAEKAYTKEREKEVFEMLQTGCTITEGKVFMVMGHLHDK